MPAQRDPHDAPAIRAFGITGYPLDLLQEVGEQGEVDVVLSYCHSNLLNTRMDAVLGTLVIAKYALHIDPVTALLLGLAVCTLLGLLSGLLVTRFTLRHCGASEHRACAQAPRYVRSRLGVERTHRLCDR